MRPNAEMTPAPVSEGARRATADAGAHSPVGALDPEVTERAKRRRFTAEYKLRILRQADACRGDGDLGALLRREGLYSSNLTSWRRERNRGAEAALVAKKRGPKKRAVDPRVKQLERENARLKRRLGRVELMLIQGSLFPFRRRRSPFSHGCLAMASTDHRLSHRRTPMPGSVPASPFKGGPIASLSRFTHMERPTPPHP